MSDDVLVVGGGIEGYAAALSALDADPSASVRLLRQSSDRFATETGLIDLLGYEPDGTGPVEKPLSAIDRLPASHPYAELGHEPIESALALFDEVAGDQYAGGETNALFPTAVGRFAPALRYPRSVANGVMSGPESMRLVGFEELPDFDAELAADRLDEKTALEVAGRTLRSPLAAETATEMATQLDDNEVIDGQPAREAMADTLEPVLDVEPRIGLPAVLGRSETGAIIEDLARQLHVSVFEVPLGPPSVPGRRLAATLAEAVESRGGTVGHATVGGIEKRDGRIEAVLGEGSRHEADSYILATGGVEAGGIVGRPELVEPVFGCPVSSPDERLISKTFLGDHPAVRAGVETDDRSRPTAGGDSPVAENLYAAGRVRKSPNVVADHAAGGIALVTGYEAGRRACEQS